MRSREEIQEWMDRFDWQESMRTYSQRLIIELLLDIREKVCGPIRPVEEMLAYHTKAAHKTLSPED